MLFTCMFTKYLTHTSALAISENCSINWIFKQQIFYVTSNYFFDINYEENNYGDLSILCINKWSYCYTKSYFVYWIYLEFVWHVIGNNNFDGQLKTQYLLGPSSLTDYCYRGRNQLLICALRCDLCTHSVQIIIIDIHCKYLGIFTHFIFVLLYITST